MVANAIVFTGINVHGWRKWNREERMSESMTKASALEEEKAYEAKDRMMRNFRYAHLPPRLQDVSLRFAANARWIVDNIPSSPERTVALRKLLESKDCAVRARLEADEQEATK